MHKNLRISCVALLAALAAMMVAGALHAVGQGRLLGTVNDDSGAPVPGVKVIITSPDVRTYHQEKTTDAKGRFSLIILDATLQYQIRLEKQGYPATEQPLTVKVDEPTAQTFILHKGAVNEAQKGQSAEEVKKLEGKNAAITVFNEAVTAAQAKDNATAIAKFEQAWTMDQSLVQTQSALAQLYLEQGKNAEALAAADRYIAAAGSDPANEGGKKRMLAVRYDALHAMGDKQRAAEALDALVTADRSRDSAIRVYNLAADAQREGHFELAIKDLKRALEIDNTLEPAYSSLANQYLSSKQFKEALATADAWIAVSPKSVEALTVRFQALSALKDGRAKEAKAAIEAAKQGAKPEELYHQGVNFFNANNIPDATAAFEGALKVMPDYAKAHYMLGLCYANSNEIAKAKEHLQEFLRLAPNDPDAATARDMLKSLG